MIEPFANDPLVTAVRRDAVPERVGAVIRHVLAQFVGADHGAAGDSAIIQPQRGIVNDSTGVRRQVTARSRRVLPRCSRQPSTLYATSRVASRLPAATAVILASTVIAACGSGSPSNSSSSGSSGSNSSQTQLQQEALNFAGCMRSHGVSNFPDPTPNGGGFNVNVPGINPSSPAFKAAQTACRQLLPVKRPQSGPPSAHAYMRLLHWAGCMRAHGMSGLPDPRPDPPPSQSNLYGTLMGDGGYWVGIPTSINAHSPAFMHLSTVCGESPNGHHS